MDAMFSRCYKLTTLDLGSFNTSKVTDMSEMFRNCSTLQTIYVGDGWVMSDMLLAVSRNMFRDCTSLVGGQGTAYDPAHVDADYAHIDGGLSDPGYFSYVAPEAYACYVPWTTTLTFYYDNYRKSRPGTIYDLNEGDADAGWDTDGNCTNVTNVVFDPSFANARPTSTYDWFHNMWSLTEITGLSYLNTSEVTNMAYMFLNCIDLTSLDLSHFNTSKVTDMTWMFTSCYALQTIYVGDGWDTDAVTESQEIFKQCTSLVGGAGTTYDANHIDKAYAQIDGGTDNPGYFTRDPYAPAPYACYTSENNTLTFYYDYEHYLRPGTTYDLNEGTADAGWDTDGTKYKVTKVVFDPSFAGARPTSTYGWFYEMKSLQSITGLEYLNTSKVTNMGWMFGYCQNLTSVDLSHFNTSRVTTMTNMFYECEGLTSLDLSSFNTSKVTNMEYMFSNCSNLQTIYVGSGWDTTALELSRGMFFLSRSLVGGQGTTWDIDNPDGKTYAHVDGGPDNPGYFTEKFVALRGDINLDGKVDISDVVALVNVILKDSDFSGREDVNEDGSVDISDVVVLVNIILGQ